MSWRVPGNVVTVEVAIFVKNTWDTRFARVVKMMPALYMRDNKRELCRAVVEYGRRQMICWVALASQASLKVEAKADSGIAPAQPRSSLSALRHGPNETL